MKTLSKVPTQSQFIEAYNRFLDSIIQNAKLLGDMLAAMMQEKTTTIDDLAQQGFSRETLNKLYRIGLGQLDSRLLIESSPAVPMIEQLPLAQQQKLLDDGVPVIVDVTADGKGVQKIKPIAMLTTKEVKKAFREDGSLRPATEQAEELRCKKHSITFLPAEPPDRVKISDDGETIQVLEKTEFTLSRWMELGELAMKRQTEFLQSTLQKKQVAKRGGLTP
jgi:hypothetical protein